METIREKSLSGHQMPHVYDVALEAGHEDMVWEIPYHRMLLIVPRQENSQDGYVPGRCSAAGAAHTREV